MLKDAAARVVARTVINRYDSGDGTVEEIINSYTMDDTDREKVLANVCDAFIPSIEGKNFKNYNKQYINVIH